MKVPGFVRERIERQRDRNFLKAAMAAGALTAYADGTVSVIERHKVEDVLDSLERLHVQDVDKALEKFEDFVAALERDTETAERVLAGKLRRIASDREAAELIAYIALEVGHADDHFNRAERMQFEAICEILHLKARDYT